MDYNALVNEILTRVLAKLKEAELSATPSSCNKPDESSNSGNTCTTTVKPVACKEKQLTKRVVVERDMRAATEEGVTRIILGEKTIVTDVAKDYATRYKIELTRC